MLDLKLSTRKLNALQSACFQNTLRLHFDSVLLAKERSFASAFAISVIASKELGKAFGGAEIILSYFNKGRLQRRRHDVREDVAFRSQAQATMVRQFLFRHFWSRGCS